VGGRGRERERRGWQMIRGIKCDPLLTVDILGEYRRWGRAWR